MRRASIALAIVLFSVCLSPLRRELYVGDETKYSQVVREMRAGSFFLPTLEGSPFTHKPPLHFWLIDLLTYPFGVYSIWPFVLPSLIAFALLLLLMQRMGGPIAAFVCGTSLLMWGSAQTARMDVAFAALLALSAYFIRREKGALPVSAGVATGIAFLVKGPMAPVITLALFAFESIRVRRRPRGRDALAVLPMIVIPLLWLVPALMIGGEPFWREIFYKQTVGRAVGAWVHKSPPWFYLARAPLTLLPWFFLAVAAIVAAYRRNEDQAKFAVSWILAVLVPYSLLSSKLDVYMIAMLPAVALLIGCFVTTDDAWGRRANLVMLALFALIGVAGLFVQPSQIKGEDGALVARLDVRMLFAILLAAAIVAIVVTLRGTLATSTLATGFVPVAALAYAAVALVPLANELASTRPLVRALQRQIVEQHVAPETAALYVCPHLWVRGMSPALWRAAHVDAGELHTIEPQLIVARRKDAEQISYVLSRYERVDQLRMIGKWFDVYRKEAPGASRK
jgi:4-amino-4-deoxy-L-arabinose transferase-like glycosyltransferase